MPPLRVRDKQTGKVDTIDWNGNRPPTRAEVLRAISQKQGAPMRVGGNIPDDVPAPMVTPNLGRPSPFNRTSSSMFGDKESSTGLGGLITGETVDGPSTFSKITDTMWGGEHSVLPPIRGITRPALPEAPASVIGQPGIYPGGDLEAEYAGASKLYNDYIRPSTSAIGAASDWATGKVAGAVGRPLMKHVGRPLWNKAASMFGRGAEAATEVLPPVIKKAQLQIPERAASASRYAVDEKGLTTDLTRPYSRLEQKPFDPRTATGPSGIVDPATGVVGKSRDTLGRFVKPVKTPPTIKASEIPNVDIPPEIQSAYPRDLPSTPALSNVPPPNVRLTSSQQRAFRQQAENRTSDIGKRHQLSPTDDAIRGGPTTAEYVGTPQRSAKVEGPVTRSWQTPRHDVSKAIRQRTAAEDAARALIEEARVNPSKRVQNAASEVRGFAGKTVDDVAADAGLRGQVGTAEAIKRGQAQGIFGKYSNVITKERVEETLNIPRSIMSSLDLSAPLRQGIGMIHKPEFYKALPKMVKAFSSEDFFKASQKGLSARPNAGKYRKSKLAITDLEKPSKREELFMSSYAEQIPVLGRAIRASGRGYVTFLNHLRADVFDNLTEAAVKAGTKVDERSLAKFINTSTGRGEFGKSIERAVPILNATLFSPRLIKSRLDMLNPVYYAKLDKTARKEAIKSLAAVTGATTTILGLAKAGGAEVETDPRSSDFAKIKIGRTRLDIAGGFQQYIRAAAQLGSNKRKDLESGRVIELGKGYREDTRADVAQKFGESKLAPIPSFIWTMMKGRDFTGQKTDVMNEAVRRMTPMITQDLKDLYEEDPDLMILAFPAIFGASVQTHKRRSSKRKAQ